MRIYRVELESKSDRFGDFVVEGRDIADATRNLLIESGGFLCKWVGKGNLTIILTPIDCNDKKTSDSVPLSVTTDYDA